MKINNSYSSSPPKVVGSGLVAWDVILKDQHWTSDAALGGSTGNVLAILAFLGWASVPVARLGRDVAASNIKNEFLSLRADTRFLKEEENTLTPVVYQWPGSGGRTHKFSFSCPVCGMKRSFVPSSDVAHCEHVLSGVDSPEVFYFDRVTPWSLKLAEEYRRRGVLVMFEPSCVEEDSQSFQRAITASHILKYADERIEQLESFDRAGLMLEIQTAGAEGLSFRCVTEGKSKWHRLDAIQAPTVADTAGAGDWCTSGLLHSLIRRGSWSRSSLEDVTKALRYGQMLAAMNCMLPGARGLARMRERLLVKETLAKLLDDDLFVRWNSARLPSCNSSLGRVPKSSQYVGASPQTLRRFDKRVVCCAGQCDSIAAEKTF